MKRKISKKQKRRRKKKSPRWIIRDKLWEICKFQTRTRDNNICQKCGKVVEGTNCHTSHVIPVSYSLRLAYDLVNLKILCYHCHINWWHKNPVEAGDWFKKKFPKRWKYLQKRKIEIQYMGSVKLYELEEWLENLRREIE